MPVLKWFAVVDLMEADERRISAERHSKIVDLACACRILGELRSFTGGQDSRLWLDGVAEVDNAFITRRNSPASEVRTDAFLVLLLDVSPRHEPKPTSRENLNEWLPMVHIIISTFTSFQAGTFYRVSLRYLLRNILSSLLYASIANSGNLSCQNGCYETPM